MEENSTSIFSILAPHTPILIGAIIFSFVFGSGVRLWIKRATKTDIPEGDELAIQLRHEIDSKMKIIYYWVAIGMLASFVFWPKNATNSSMDKYWAIQFFCYLLIALPFAEKFYFKHLLKKVLGQER